MKKDEFSIYERLIENIRKEIQSDRDGISRNLSVIEELKDRNVWLLRRAAENVKAEKLLLEAHYLFVRGLWDCFNCGKHMADCECHDGDFNS